MTLPALTLTSSIEKKIPLCHRRRYARRLYILQYKECFEKFRRHLLFAKHPHLFVAHIFNGRAVDRIKRIVGGKYRILIHYRVFGYEKQVTSFSEKGADIVITQFLDTKSNCIFVENKVTATVFSSSILF